MVLMGKLWRHQSPLSPCHIPFTFVIIKIYFPEDLLSLYLIDRLFTLINTNFPFVVPQQTLEQDSGVHSLLYAHVYVSFHGQIHTSVDDDINIKSLLPSNG